MGRQQMLLVNRVLMMGGNTSITFSSLRTDKSLSFNLIKTLT
jgi:hypothetical protein